MVGWVIVQMDSRGADRTARSRVLMLLNENAMNVWVRDGPKQRALRMSCFHKRVFQAILSLCLFVVFFRVPESALYFVLGHGTQMVVCLTCHDQPIEGTVQGYVINIRSVLCVHAFLFPGRIAL